MKKIHLYIYIAFFLPVLIASLIRFWDIDLRPFHSDEGVNSFFLRDLFDKNYYHYDPTNYHGPFFYYIGLIPFYILGISDFSFRLMPALFGAMIVALLYPLRRRLGWPGLLTTGLLIAISPADSFFSRDAIHETYLIFFTLAIVVSFFLYSESRKARYIYFGAVSLAFTITVKETYIITFVIYGLSLASAYLYEWIVRCLDGQQQCSATNHEQLESSIQHPASSIQPYLKIIFTTFLNDCWKRKYTIAISIVMFLFINFLFYSSFFTYYKGIDGILTTLSVWTKTGTHSAGGHSKPFIYYFTLLRKYELPILASGICGIYYVFCGYFFKKDKRKFGVFIASWAALIYLAYSLIPYKTPWLVINITLPLAILGGIFVNGIYQEFKVQSSKFKAEGSAARKGWYFAVFYPIYVSIFGFFCYQSIALNFINYDDDRHELVYVQTTRDIYNLLDALELLSGEGGKEMTINIIAESHWPLPWYLRGYKNARFWGKSIPDPNAPVILVDEKGVEDLEKRLIGGYETKRFGLRPGVWIIAYIQKGLYEAVYGKKEVSESLKQTVIKVSAMDELKPGLIQRCYYNVECLGDPFLSIVADDSISFAYHDLSKKPYRAPFGIEWEGYLLIQQKGVYQFATKSDDGSKVYIDGEIVVDNGGFHAMRYISGAVFLDAGFHHIKVDYFDGGGGAIMELLWTRPGAGETPIPVEMLFHRIEDLNQ